MQKNEFEAMIKELLPDVTEQAMEKWTQYAPIPPQISVRQSLVLFRDRMVTNCLLFACRASAGEELRRALYSTGWCGKNQAPFCGILPGIVPKRPICP